MIANRLQHLIGEALKAHDEVRLSTLRLLSSAFNYEKIEKQHDLNDSEEQSVIRKEAKKRKDAIEMYERAGEQERLEREKNELNILREFLPAEATEEEIQKAVDEFVADKMQIGQAIGVVKSKLPNADGAIIAKFVNLKIKK